MRALCLLLLSGLLLTTYSSCVRMREAPDFIHGALKSEVRTVQLKNLKVFGELEFLAPLPVGVSTEFRLRLYELGPRGEKVPYDLNDVQIYAWLWMEMPTGSHPSPEFTYVTQATDIRGTPIRGSFILSPIYFSMDGTWQLHIEIRKGLEINGRRIVQPGERLDKDVLDLSI